LIKFICFFTAKDYQSLSFGLITVDWPKKDLFIDLLMLFKQ